MSHIVANCQISGYGDCGDVLVSDTKPVHTQKHSGCTEETLNWCATKQYDNISTTPPVQLQIHMKTSVTPLQTIAADQSIDIVRYNLKLDIETWLCAVLKIDLIHASYKNTLLYFKSQRTSPFLFLQTSQLWSGEKQTKKKKSNHPCKIVWTSANTSAILLSFNGHTFNQTSTKKIRPQH